MVAVVDFVDDVDFVVEVPMGARIEVEAEVEIDAEMKSDQAAEAAHVEAEEAVCPCTTARDRGPCSLFRLSLPCHLPLLPLLPALSSWTAIGDHLSWDWRCFVSDPDSAIVAFG